LTLALAIGANAVVFGIFNGMILRPLDVPQAESLYGTSMETIRGGSRIPTISICAIAIAASTVLRRSASSFRASNTGKDPSGSSGYTTSGNYFDVLRIQPYLGRFYHAADEHGPNSAPMLC